MSIITPILQSFIVGGLFSVLGQVFMVAYNSVLGPTSPFVVPLTLVSLGIVGAILFILGLYQKIEKVGAFGAILPFCGLAAAVAGLFSGTKTATGSWRAGLKAALSLVVYVLGLGTILSIIVGVVAFYAV